MTETTPTMLAARDALARGLFDTGWLEGTETPRPVSWEAIGSGLRAVYYRQADRLLATVVRDVGTLAADETLVDAVWDALDRDGHNDLHCEPVCGSPTAANAIRALAAALGDRPAPTTEGNEDDSDDPRTADEAMRLGW